MWDEIIYQEQGSLERAEIWMNIQFFSEELKFVIMLYSMQLSL